MSHSYVNWPEGKHSWLSPTFWIAKFMEFSPFLECKWETRGTVRSHHEKKPPTHSCTRPVDDFPVLISIMTLGAALKCWFRSKFVYFCWSLSIFSSVQPHSPLLVHWFTKKWWNQSEELEKWVPLTLNETCFIMFLRKCPMKMEVFSLREPWKPSKLGDSPQNQLVLVAPFEAGMKFNWLPWLLDFRGVGGLRKLRIYVLLTW